MFDMDTKVWGPLYFTKFPPVVIRNSTFRNLTYASTAFFITYGRLGASYSNVIIENSVFEDISTARGFLSMEGITGGNFLLSNNLFNRVTQSEWIREFGLFTANMVQKMNVSIDRNEFRDVYAPSGIIKLFLNNMTFVNIQNNVFGYSVSMKSKVERKEYISVDGNPAIAIFGIADKYQAVTTANNKFLNWFTSPTLPEYVISGAIYLTGSNINLEIRNSQFVNNAAKNAGACIVTLDLIDSWIDIEGSMFDNNFAPSGGVMYIGKGDESNNITIRDSVFKNNTAISGGVMKIDGKWLKLGFDLLNVTFLENKAYMGGGIGYFPHVDFIPQSLLAINALNTTNTAAYGNVIATDPFSMSSFIRNSTDSHEIAMITSGSLLPEIDVLLFDSLGQQIKNPNTGSPVNSFVVIRAQVLSYKAKENENASTSDFGVELDTSTICVFWQGLCTFDSLQVAGTPWGNYSVNFEAFITDFAALEEKSTSIPFSISTCPAGKVTKPSITFSKYLICREPVCSCMNDGVCVEDDVCVCEVGYSGKNCNEMVFYLENENTYFGIMVGAGIILAMILIKLAFM
ncbi:hypothetical protein HK098_006576, partial [Nowakowskiella sp. JEL0407]